MKSIRGVLLALPLSLFIAGEIKAQLVRLPSPGSFSEAAVLMDFTGFQPGVEASEIYTKWDVSFSGPTTPKVAVLEPLIPIPGQPPNPYLENGKEEPSSSRSALVVDLARPAVRFGFDLIVPKNASATVRAYDRYGNLLGSLAQETSGFLGFQTSEPLGITKVTVEYPGNEEAEAIDNLLVDFLTRPSFTTYLPQMADAGGLDTSIIILNVSGSTAQGEVRFFDSSGQAMSLEISGQLTSAIPFSLAPAASKFLALRGSNQQPRTGYGYVTSSVPVSVQAVYHTKTASDSGELEAGIVSGTASANASGAVGKDVIGSFNSAIAVVNTSASQASTWVVLRDETGEVIASNNSDFSLAGHHHAAKFLSELFPQLTQIDFKGSVDIVSTQPLAAVILRTVRGYATSSMPLGDTRKR